MGIDLDAKLVETASKVVTTQNEYGDVSYGSTTSSACLYRDISLLNEAANQETVGIDGILWFSGTETVELGDVYYHADEGYLRIQRIFRAKRLLLDNTKPFVKTFVSKQRQIS